MLLKSDYVWRYVIIYLLHHFYTYSNPVLDYVFSYKQKYTPLPCPLLPAELSQIHFPHLHMFVPIAPLRPCLHLFVPTMTIRTYFLTIYFMPSQWQDFTFHPNGMLITRILHMDIIHMQQPIMLHLQNSFLSQHTIYLKEFCCISILYESAPWYIVCILLATVHFS